MASAAGHRALRPRQRWTATPPRHCSSTCLGPRDHRGGRARRVHAELRVWHHADRRRREGRGAAVRAHAAARRTAPRATSTRSAARSSFFWRSREPVGPTAVPDLPRRLRRPLELGHGLAAHRLQRPRLRCLRHRRQPGAHARVRRSGPRFPGPKQWTHLALAWDETHGHPLLRERHAGGAARTTTAVFDAGARPVRPALADHQPLPGAERLQLRPRRRHRRTAHLRPHARRTPTSRRWRAGRRAAPRCRGARPRPRAPAWRDEWWYRYGWNRPGDAPPVARAPAVAPQGRDPRRLRPEAMVVEGHRRHPRDHLARRLQPLAPARPQRLLPVARLGLLLAVGQDVTFTMPDEPWNQLEIVGRGVRHASTLAGRRRAATPLFERPKGAGASTFHRLAAAA